ncbi:MAG: hypothetical protein LBB60_02840 [Desulfovibrio sp.]|jgi:hypothetical protein|nr:hypothetical protein [Desulfovibrio sp.]
MSKYTVRYACGHGEHTEQLYGKEAERQRKIAWMESEVVCPECFKKKAQEKAQAEGLIFNMAVNTIPGQRVVYITAWFTGDTRPHKEAIKALGFHWGDMPPMSMMDYVSIRKPPVAWWDQWEYKLTDLIAKLGVDAMSEHIASEIKRIEALVRHLPLADKKMPSSILDLYALGQEAAAAKGEADKLSQLVRPLRPEWARGKKWNCKIYGNVKHGYRVYFDGEETSITNEQQVELAAYLTEYTAYTEAVEKIKKGG